MRKKDAHLTNPVSAKRIPIYPALSFCGESWEKSKKEKGVSNVKKQDQTARLGGAARLGLLPLLVCFLSLLGIADAKLNMQSGIDFIDVVPNIVNADSVLPITFLQRNDGADSFSAGDCFEIEFANVPSYEVKQAGHYVPIKDTAVTTCSFVPAATCTRENSNLLKFKLTAGGNTIDGNIGNIKNPYSVVTLNLYEIRYYQGCSSSTPTDTTINDFS